MSNITISNIYVKVETSNLPPFENYIRDRNFQTVATPGFMQVQLPHPISYKPETDNLFIDGVLSSLEYELDDNDDETIPRVKAVFTVTYAGRYRKITYAHECLPARIQAAQGCIDGENVDDLLDVMRDQRVTYTLISEEDQTLGVSGPYHMGTWHQVQHHGDYVNKVFLPGQGDRQLAVFSVPNYKDVMRILDQARTFAELPLVDQQALEVVLRAVIRQYREIDHDGGERGTCCPQVKFYRRRPLALKL